MDFLGSVSMLFVSFVASDNLSYDALLFLIVIGPQSFQWSLQSCINYASLLSLNNVDYETFLYLVRAGGYPAFCLALLSTPYIDHHPMRPGLPTPGNCESV